MLQGPKSTDTVSHTVKVNTDMHINKHQGVGSPGVGLPSLLLLALTFLTWRDAGRYGSSWSQLPFSVILTLCTHPPGDAPKNYSESVKYKRN